MPSGSQETLLHSGRTCDGCNCDIDLSGRDARNQIHVHTVDPYRSPDPTPPFVPRTGGSQYSPSIRYRPSLRFEADDWPAVLCRRCHETVEDGGCRRFLDFRFGQHPACSQCGGRIARGGAAFVVRDNPSTPLRQAPAGEHIGDLSPHGWLLVSAILCATKATSREESQR